MRQHPEDAGGGAVDARVLAVRVQVQRCVRCYLDVTGKEKERQRQRDRERQRETETETECVCERERWGQAG